MKLTKLNDLYYPNDPDSFKLCYFNGVTFFTEEDVKLMKELWKEEVVIDDAPKN